MIADWNVVFVEHVQLSMYNMDNLDLSDPSTLIPFARYGER